MDLTATSPTAATSARRSLRRVVTGAWRSRAGHFVRHYTEMVVAMVSGMVALGMPAGALLELAGIDVSAWPTDAPELVLLGMAVTMSLPMAAWMRYRGHGWPRVYEMTASMFVPSFAVIGLLWTGIVEDTDALLAIQHAGMLPSMLVAMLLRLDEYTAHDAHAHAA